MKNKKDKVTLKEGEVDKPEVFQHFTGGIDPYHIEPIDNPQKPKIGSTLMHVRSALLNASVEITLQEIERDHPEVLKRFIEKHYGK